MNTVSCMFFATDSTLEQVSQLANKLANSRRLEKWMTIQFRAVTLSTNTQDAVFSAKVLQKTIKQQEHRQVILFGEIHLQIRQTKVIVCSTHG